MTLYESNVVNRNDEVTMVCRYFRYLWFESRHSMAHAVRGKRVKAATC